MNPTIPTFSHPGIRECIVIINFYQLYLQHITLLRIRLTVDKNLTSPTSNSRGGFSKLKIRELQASQDRAVVVLCTELENIDFYPSIIVMEVSEGETVLVTSKERELPKLVEEVRHLSLS
jgi:hypothetical protein